MFPARHRDPTDPGEPRGRIEEILEIAQIVDEAADRIATVLERSGAGRRHDRRSLREMARRELELAAVDIGQMTFGVPGGF